MNKQMRTYYWIVSGVNAYNLMKAGKFATVARLMKWGLLNGIFEPDDSDGSSWRTSILLNYSLDEL